MLPTQEGVVSKSCGSNAWIGGSCAVLFIALVALAMLFAGTGQQRGSANLKSSDSRALRPAAEVARESLRARFAALPLTFEENEGQMDPRAQYMARGSGYRLFLTSSDAVLALASSSASRMSRPRQIMEERFVGSSRKRNELIRRQMARESETSSSVAALRMHLVNGNLAAQVEGRGLLPSKTNYFIGNDPRKWHAGVKEFATVAYSEVYPGVDLVYHGQEKQLEFDFVIAPNANSSAIALRFAGAREMKLDKSGNLLLHSAAGDITVHKPVAYQEKNHVRERVEAGFVLGANHQMGFALGNYDKSRELVIDPSISYATYIGGNADDEGYGIAVDVNGNSYVTGESDSTSRFPGSNPSDGGFDCFVVKINADGSRGYTTFVGGSGDDLGSSIATNAGLATGTVFVAGITTSTNLPVSAGAVQSTSGSPAGTQCTTGTGSAPCTDAFVFELSPSGAPSYVTYLGGSNDDGAFGIAVDGSGNAYVAGFTFSANFPTANALYSQLNDGQNTTFEDGFVTEINPTGTAFVYSSYLGGANNDFASAIAVDAKGAAYVTGGTTSAGPTNGFPVTAGAFQTECGTDGTCNAGNGRIFSDAFVTKFAPNGASLDYSTYLGGSSDDIGGGINLDASDNVYVTGQTTDDNPNATTDDFPIAGGFETSYGNGNNGAMSNAFVSELALNGQGASDLKYSSYLGGSTADVGMGLAADGAGNAYVTGSTLSSDFPVTNGSTLNGPSDAFVSYVASGGGSLVYSTYLGGPGDENFDPSTSSFLGAGINLTVCGSPTANIYVAGTTDSSTGFPVTASALQANYGGNPFDGFEATIGLISGPDFAICASTPGAVNAGSSATSIVTLTSTNDTNAVNLTCTVSGNGSPLPACGGFSPSSVTPSAGGVTSTLTITTTGASAQSSQSKTLFYALWLPMGGLLLAGLGAGSASRRRKKMLWVVLLGAVAAGLLFLPACGGGSSNSNNGGGGGGGGGCSGCTPSGNYTVTVTGTGTDPAKTTHSTTFTLAVN
jgi:hypothetical protein